MNDLEFTQNGGSVIGDKEALEMLHDYCISQVPAIQNSTKVQLTLMMILFLPFGPKEVLTISVMAATACIFRMTASSIPLWNV